MTTANGEIDNRRHHFFHCSRFVSLSRLRSIGRLPTYLRDVNSVKPDRNWWGIKVWTCFLTTCRDLFHYRKTVFVLDYLPQHPGSLAMLNVSRFYYHSAALDATLTKIFDYISVEAVFGLKLPG